MYRSPLTAHQARLLHWVASRGEVTAKEIAELNCTGIITIYAQTRALIVVGMLQKRREPLPTKGHPRWLYTVTPKGSKMSKDWYFYQQELEP